MEFSQLFPGRFIKAGDLIGKDVTLTIKSVRLEELPDDRGASKTKGILEFEQTKRELVLNRTNAEAIRAMFGRETDDWVGKRVTFYPENVSFGDSDIAIRVRGSPDIEKPISFELKLARKKPRTVTLQRTGAKQKKPETEAAPESGEIRAPVDSVARTVRADRDPFS